VAGLLVAALIGGLALAGSLLVRREEDDGARPPLVEPPTDLAPERALKPPGGGLYWIGAPDTALDFVDHAVIGIPWASLEPEEGDFVGPGWARIRRMLRTHPDFGFRLRISAGRWAPGWVKSMSGGCVEITQPANGITSCVPRFWTADYLDAYERLMEEVARRYDDEDRVLDVVNSACMTNWAEPFIRAGNDPASNTNLSRAGLDERSDRYCLERSTADMMETFERTRVSIATHTHWQLVRPDGVDLSWGKQRAVLNRLRHLYGAQLVIQNNGLGGDEGCAPGEPVERASSMWCWMASADSPKGFATEGDGKLEAEGHSVEDAIRRALRMGGCFVEHNQFGSDLRLARRLNARLEAGC
jgi:hypothetical protein